MKVGAVAVYVAAFSASASALWHRPGHHHSRRDVSARLDVKHNASDLTEGEEHDKPKAPHGSQLINLPVDKKSKVAVYWSYYTDDKTTERAFIMMHGKLRDGDKYWTVMNDVYQGALKSRSVDVNNRTIIAAPQFYSTKLNKGQYADDELAWSDPNTWQAGEPANHPDGTDVTAFDALDAIVEYFADKKQFPKMKNITVVGHGGGGQLINRYSAVGATPKGADDVHVRYIVGDPSSSPYFTKDRPQMDDGPKKSKCEEYNTWRYGFDGFNGTKREGKKDPKEYFKQYINRDVVNIIGYKDTKSNGDQKCMANMQGGKKRRDRNLTWWRYVNELARTNEKLKGFPHSFKDLPDWSDVSNKMIMPRLVVVPNADHDAEDVFSGKYGRSALFDDKNIKTGWRPKGRKAATPPKNSKNSSSSGGGNGSSSSSSSSSSGGSNSSSSGNSSKSGSGSGSNSSSSSSSGSSGGAGSSSGGGGGSSGSGNADRGAGAGSSTPSNTGGDGNSGSGSGSEEDASNVGNSHAQSTSAAAPRIATGLWSVATVLLAGALVA